MGITINKAFAAESGEKLDIAAARPELTLGLTGWLVRLWLTGNALATKTDADATGVVIARPPSSRREHGWSFSALAPGFLLPNYLFGPPSSSLNAPAARL